MTIHIVCSDLLASFPIGDAGPPPDGAVTLLFAKNAPVEAIKMPQRQRQRRARGKEKRDEGEGATSAAHNRRTGHSQALPSLLCALPSRLPHPPGLATLLGQSRARPPEAATHWVFSYLNSAALEAGLASSPEMELPRTVPASLTSLDSTG